MPKIKTTKAEQTDFTVSSWRPPLRRGVEVRPFTMRQLQDNQAMFVLPKTQRNYVWKLAQKQLLIDSFLMGYPVPALEASFSDDQPEVLNVNDGQQRLRTILDFMDNQFKAAALVDPDGNVLFSSRYFTELPEEWRRRFEDGTVEVRAIREERGISRSKLFLRYQNGTPLNTNETLHANDSMFAQAVNLLMELTAWERFAGDNALNRMGHLPMAAAALVIEAHGIGTSIQTKTIKAHMEGKHDSSAQWIDVADLVDRRLTTLEGLFDGDHTGWGKLDFVLAYGGLKALIDRGVQLDQVRTAGLTDWVNAVVPTLPAPTGKAPDTRGSRLKVLETTSGLQTVVTANIAALITLLQSQ